MFADVLSDLRARMSKVELSELSRVTGRHANVLLRIANGSNTNPTVDTITVIAEGLTQLEKEMPRRAKRAKELRGRHLRVKERLKGVNLASLSHVSGCSYANLLRIRDGSNANPREATIKRIEEALSGD